MIKIEEIEPIDIKSRSKYKVLADLESDFLKRVSNGSMPPVKRLKEIISSLNTADPHYTEKILLIRYLRFHFKKIITSGPDVLVKFMDRFKNKGWDILLHDGKSTTDFGNEISKAFGYDERFRGGIKRGIWFANIINIKACPYCNAQYTVYVDHNKKKFLKFQFDHFFSKSKYPYLSISMYNLIPSCASCNNTKSDRDYDLIDHYHPYYSDVAKGSFFKLIYNPDPKVLTIENVKSQNLTIGFLPKYKSPDKFVETHNNLYHIDGIYNRHQDIAVELLCTAIIYTEKMVQSQLTIKGLFQNESEYYRFLLRNYHLEKDILKRPLTKFTQDIARQLGLI